MNGALFFLIAVVRSWRSWENLHGGSFIPCDTHARGIFTKCTRNQVHFVLFIQPSAASFQNRMSALFQKPIPRDCRLCCKSNTSRSVFILLRRTSGRCQTPLFSAPQENIAEITCKCRWVKLSEVIYFETHRSWLYASGNIIKRLNLKWNLWKFNIVARIWKGNIIFAVIERCSSTVPKLATSFLCSSHHSSLSLN